MNVTGVIIIMYKIHLEEVSLNMYNYYGAKTKHKVFRLFMGNSGCKTPTTPVFMLIMRF